MIVCCPVTGYMDVNCYVWVDPQSRHGFLVDPGAMGGELLETCRRRGWILDGILLTHGHFDHIGGIAEIRQEADIPVLIHENGPAYLDDPRMNLSYYFGGDIRVTGAQVFRDGDVLRPKEGKGALRVIHTPGHTQDSVLFYDEAQGEALSGDTVFLGSRGNDSFPGGDGMQLLKSIRERVMTLPADTVLYPGHGDRTTVGAERPLYL